MSATDEHRRDANHDPTEIEVGMVFALETYVCGADLLEREESPV